MTCTLDDELANQLSNIVCEAVRETHFTDNHNQWPDLVDKLLLCEVTREIEIRTVVSVVSALVSDRSGAGLFVHACISLFSLFALFRLVSKGYLDLVIRILSSSHDEAVQTNLLQTIKEIIGIIKHITVGIVIY